MKKLFIVLSVAVMMAAFVTSGLTAEGCKKQGDMKMMGHGEKGQCCSMMTELNLTDAQKAEIDKIKQGCMETKKAVHTKLMELHQKQCDLMKAEKPEKEAIDKIIDESAKLEAEMKKGCVDCMLKVSALLTPEQLKKMQEMKAKCAKEEGKGCGKGHGHQCKSDCCKGKAEGCKGKADCCKGKAEGCKGKAPEAKVEAAKCSQSATCDKAKTGCK